ncbi:sodium-dependent dicarboxylate transporter 2/3/5 [Aequitasia blattaphilus]|uniref:Citrate transporter n=1 Tax=Aequitasia blattaphilus TaxID=2949332 RepID=A0ABT1E8P2_9FIRM|nr:SLC13 family permease [Aequitasia blattaphilus]MCP1102194.1 citrate transporter [Aequitasia blattaphilus]MCR8614834.1 citrate transporter [Aequitasia blattaphilus]
MKENTKGKEKTARSHIVHSLIGVGIMIFFRFLPIPFPEGTVTPTGQEILGIFIGTLYMWTTADVLWGSLISAFFVGISSYAPMPQVLNEYFGSTVFVQLFFLMMVIQCLVDKKITAYMGRFFLTRKMNSGRPWVFTTVVLIGVLLMSAFIIAFAPIILMWPVLYGIFEDVGFTKQDKYPKIMIILVAVVAIIGFPIPPFMNNGLALLSNYRAIAEEPGFISDPAYLFFGLVIGLIMIFVIILFTKFVLRPDVEKLKSFDVESLKKDPLPPMDLSQKITTAVFVVLILLMLVPSIVLSITTAVPGMQFLKENSTGLALGATAILVGIRIANKPVMEIKTVMSGINWNTLLLCATAILIGGVLTADVTGIKAFLQYILNPLFDGMGTVQFMIFILLVAVVLTNICNSLVIGMVLLPVIYTYCTASGANAAPIVSCMIIFVLGSACTTPAASPFAAMMHGNKEWLQSKDIYKYTLSFVIIETIIMLVIGIPLAQLMIK